MSTTIVKLIPNCPISRIRNHHKAKISHFLFIFVQYIIYIEYTIGLIVCKLVRLMTLIPMSLPIIMTGQEAMITIQIFLMCMYLNVKPHLMLQCGPIEYDS